MSAKQPEPVQFEFDFVERVRECVCAYPRSFDSHVVAFEMARAAAMIAQREACATITAHEQEGRVFSMTERLARRQQVHDSSLYESILARIKHLPF